MLSPRPRDGSRRTRRGMSVHPWRNNLGTKSNQPATIQFWFDHKMLLFSSLSKSPNMRKFIEILSRCGIQRRGWSLAGRETSIMFSRLRSLAAKASAVPSASSICCQAGSTEKNPFKGSTEEEYSISHLFVRNKKDSLIRLWAEQDQGEYQLLNDGSLQV